MGGGRPPRWRVAASTACLGQPRSLRAAAWAFVLLYALRLRRSYLHALAMVPPFAHIAPDPELLRAVYPTACPT